MKRYRVTGLVTITVSTVVDAHSAKEAKELACGAPLMGLCHQCATGDDSREWVTSGELDGEITQLKAQEES